VLLARRLCEVGAPPTLVASAEEAVDNFFHEGLRRATCTTSLIPNVEEQDQDLSRVEASTEG
jgi:hypothetical protein